MPNRATRRRTCHFLLGQPAELSHTCLPLDVDIYNAIVKTRLDLQNVPGKVSNRSITNKAVFSKILESVKVIWKDKGNLPTVSDRTILDKIEKVHSKGKDLLKIPTERRTKMLEYMEENDKTPTHPGRGKKLKRKKHDFLDNLFDICSCKCEFRENCKCPKERKVAARDWDFLVDQRKDRKDQSYII